MIRAPRLSPKVLALLAAGTLGSAGAISTQFIKEEEGRSLVAYRDIGGVVTICDGETRGIKIGMVMTEGECDELTAKAVQHTLATVNALVAVPMSPARTAAVASFVYNLGPGAFERSTFRKKLNAKDPTACNEILKWRFAAGQDCSAPGNTSCPGIWARRQKEYQLCQL